MKLGIHGGVAGWTDRCVEVARELGAESYLWLALTPDGPHRPADALRYPGGAHIVRIANPARYEDPEAWMARVVPALDPWVSAGIPPGALIVQHANEPDVAAVDLPEAWDLGVWMGSAHGYRDALKARYPNLPLLAPPFSCANTKYLTAEYVAPYEGVAVHCYWAAGNPGWRQGTDGGAAWKVAAAFGKPIWITEANSNPTDVAEIVAWVREVESPLVEGATLFIADGARTWPAYDVTPAQAAAVRAGLGVLPPEPPKPPPPTATNPYAYDGDFAYPTFVAMVDGPLARKNPSVASRTNYRAVHLAARREGVSVPTMLGWCVAENVDPDLIAINNLAGIKYVGQSRAYRSNVLPPPDEQGVYAGFRTLEDFWETLAINIATVDPDAWARGDLAAIAREYTGGAWGEAKVALVDRLRAMPHGGFDDRPDDSGGGSDDTPSRYRFVYPVDAPIVQGSDGAFSHGGKSPGFYALDYGCAFGTPIRCVADGTVVYNGFNHPREGQTGHTICVAHADGSESRYCHLSEYDTPVGAAVTQGQIIAASGAPDYPYPGANGYGSGPHLHFSISLNGAWVRCEELMAAGEMGPWDASPSAKEEVDEVRVGDGFAPDELRMMWFGTNRPTKTALKNTPYEPDKLGTHGAYGLLANGQFETDEQDFTGLSVCLGKCLDKETSDPGTPGRSVIHFERGKLTALRQPDGSYLIRVN